MVNGNNTCLLFRVGYIVLVFNIPYATYMPRNYVISVQCTFDTSVLYVKVRIITHRT